jgi:hypothetical protein
MYLTRTGIVKGPPAWAAFFCERENQAEPGERLPGGSASAGPCLAKEVMSLECPGRGSRASEVMAVQVRHTITGVVCQDVWVQPVVRAGVREHHDLQWSSGDNKEKKHAR